MATALIRLLQAYDYVHKCKIVHTLAGRKVLLFKLAHFESITAWCADILNPGNVQVMMGFMDPKFPNLKLLDDQ
jgi:hypothetical protein